MTRATIKQRKPNLPIGRCSPHTTRAPLVVVAWRQSSRKPAQQYDGRKRFADCGINPTGTAASWDVRRIAGEYARHPGRIDVLPGQNHGPAAALKPLALLD